MAERSDALKKAQQKYMEKFAVARVRMERDRYERVQAHAEAQGQSVNGFINTAIDHEMEKPPVSPVEAPTIDDRAGVVSLPPGTIKAAQEAAQAAGEGVPQFVARAVETQAKRDEVNRKLGGRPGRD